MLIFYVLILIFLTAGLLLALTGFRRLRLGFKKSYQDKLDSLKQSFNRIREEDQNLCLANKRLNEKISGIANLYEITKDMSMTLERVELFEILVRHLRKNFIFKKSRLILLDKKSPKVIDKIYRIRITSQSRPAGFYTPGPRAHLNKQEGPDVALIERISREREIIKTGSYRESFVAVPIIIEDALIGVLTIEGVSMYEFDNFLILARQFILEMRKVELYTRVQELAVTDGLTGAYVRRHFLERLDEELRRSKRHKFSFSFLMLDIDYFKNLNDTYGHLVGDACLTRLVAILKSNLREMDLVARFGGEEFSILLPETDKNQALLVAQRILQAVAREEFQVYDEYTKLTVSIGISSYPDDDQRIAGLIEKADAALYKAKDEGRNRIVAV